MRAQRAVGLDVRAAQLPLDRRRRRALHRRLHAARGAAERSSSNEHLCSGRAVRSLLQPARWPGDGSLQHTRRRAQGAGTAVRHAMLRPAADCAFPRCSRVAARSHSRSIAVAANAEMVGCAHPRASSTTPRGLPIRSRRARSVSAFSASVAASVCPTAWSRRTAS